MHGYRRRLSPHAIEVHDRQKALDDDAWAAVAARMCSLVGRQRRVLDAGAGSGLISHWLHSNGADVTACDFNVSMVERLTSRTGGFVPVAIAT